MTPVPVTGSQNPAYQVTSEKEQGQTYSTNFHAITMMPAYRNASFEVSPTPTYMTLTERNYDLQIMPKVDVMEREVPLEHPLPLEEPQRERETPLVDSAPTRLIPEPQVHSDNPLKQTPPVHSEQVHLDPPTLLVHSAPTPGPAHSVKRLLKHLPLEQEQRVHLARQPTLAASDLLLPPEDSGKPPAQVHSVKNPGPSPSVAASVQTQTQVQVSAPIPAHQAHSARPLAQAVHSARKHPLLKPAHGVVSAQHRNNPVGHSALMCRIKRINLRSGDSERIPLRRRLRPRASVHLDRNLPGRGLARGLALDRRLGRILRLREV